MSSKLVRQAKRLLLSGVLLSVGLWTLPVQAQQVSDAQVRALVEALRQAAPPGDNANEGLTSDWKIKPDNIRRWSRLCTGQELTPQAFTANPTKAREILACVMRDVLRDEYKASGSSESVAVQRAASWWMTGDPNQYNSSRIRTYTQKVLGFYQQQRRSAQTPPPATPSQQPATKPAAQPPASQSQPTSQPATSPPANQSKPTSQSSVQPPANPAQPASATATQSQPAPQPSVQPPTNPAQPASVTATQSKPAPQPSVQPTARSSSPAQISDVQVGTLVEALRQAAPQTGTPNDGLYSDWQVKADNIPRWSRQCIGKELTPTQFQDSPVTARAILVCVMRDVLREQYTASNNNEFVAVQRAASWWMTGDATQYTASATAPYTEKVLGFYKQSRLKFFSHI